MAEMRESLIRSVQPILCLIDQAARAEVITEALSAKASGLFLGRSPVSAA